MAGDDEDTTPPQLPCHVLIFPLQAQGHVNSMLKLAELLCLAGLHVTFLVSDDTHHRLLRHTNVQSRFGRYPGFRLQTISDKIPSEKPHSGSGHLDDLFNSLKTTVKEGFRELLVPNRLSSETRRPVSCVIADGVLSFALDLGEEMGIPVIYFRTVSACSFWTYFCFPDLIEAGELPFRDDDKDLDELIKNVPGMEGFLRRRDLPSFSRIRDLSDPTIQFVMTETQQTPRAHGLILNTFEDLEGPILSQIRSRIPNLYTIGPLHTHLKLRVGTAKSNSSNSLFEEDRSCLTWLDAQPIKSVIYVSFGSFTVITRDQLTEFWYGLLNSGKRFLWVLRWDLVDGGQENILNEILEGAKDRGYIVGWAPQEEVLAHPSVGGFFTHSGWNSTLESIVAGKPMICWPYFADQQVNSRFVGEIWKIGLDMKDTCDRYTVEKTVNDLMDRGVGKTDRISESVDRMAELAKETLNEGGGSSYCNLERLIKDIKAMS